jgi:hypothetical protein
MRGLILTFSAIFVFLLVADALELAWAAVRGWL